MHDARGRRIPKLLSAACIGGLCVSSVIVLMLLSAPFDLGNYKINGERVSGPDFLRRAGALSAVLALATGALAFAIKRGRSWTRAPLMLSSVLYVAWMTNVAARKVNLETAALSCALGAMLLIAPLYWYLYHRRSTVAYYCSLAGADGSPSNSVRS